MLLVLGGSLRETDSDAPIGCPHWKASQPMKQPMKVLLDQIHHTTISKHNDEPTDSIESEPESNSGSQDSSTSDSEGGLVTVVPVRQRVTKKKVVAKNVGAGDTSDDDDGMDPTPICCYHLRIVIHSPF